MMIVAVSHHSTGPQQLHGWRDMAAQHIGINPGDPQLYRWQADSFTSSLDWMQEASPGGNKSAYGHPSKKAG